MASVCVFVFTMMMTIEKIAIVMMMVIMGNDSIVTMLRLRRSKMGTIAIVMITMTMGTIAISMMTRMTLQTVAIIMMTK